MDEYGNDITTRIPSRVVDCNKTYDDLYTCIYQGKTPYVKAEGVITVLNIAEEVEKTAGN